MVPFLFILQPETVNELPPVVSQFDMIAALSHKTFNERVLQVPEYMGGRKVLAALVMKKGGTDSRGTVICLGTGIVVVVYVLVFLVFFSVMFGTFSSINSIFDMIY